MIKYAADKQLPINITMFDSNRNKDNILYKEEFDRCVNANKNLKIIYTITGEGQEGSSSSYSTLDNDWKGESGFINKAMLTKYLTPADLNNSTFFICGPPGMIKAMQKLLQDDLLIPKDRIMIEQFTGY